MSVRVYTLAKELGVSNKELIAKLRKLGIKVKSHSSTVDEETADLVKGELGVPAAEEALPEPEEPSGATAVEEALPEPEETSGTTAVEEAPPEIEEKRILKLEFPIAVKDLAAHLGLKPNELIKELMAQGVFATINQKIDRDMLEGAAPVLGIELARARSAEKPQVAKKEVPEEAPEDREEDLLPRAPVVTLLGHVDHGKTSLLDYIRKTRIISKEAGGITQHIGAYSISVPGGSVSFIDTPGHKAFTSMRARGANVTDVVVLVVAADDGVMPQTSESINHAKAAGVPILVAVNKIDLPKASPDKVKKQLLEHEVVVEEYGGEVVCCEVSAKTGDGIDHLLEMILLQAEIMELKSNPHRRANGVVLEARMSRAVGPEMTLLVKRGTLKLGSPIVAGVFWGKVKALFNDRGERVKEAGPSVPVRVLGMSGVPEAGAQFWETGSEKEAKSTSERLTAAESERQIAPAKRISLEDFYKQMTAGRVKELRLILKADVQGSIEALLKSIDELRSEKVGINIVHKGVGDINESDIVLAAASDGVVLGFHVKPDEQARAAARKEAVDIRLYDVIYTATDEIKKGMEGLLEPRYEEIEVGRLEVKEVFRASNRGRAAGCVVTKGKIALNSDVKLVRNGEVIHKGKVESLRRFKEEVKEASTGLECGLRISGFREFLPEDIIEVFRVEKIMETL